MKTKYLYAASLQPGDERVLLSPADAHHLYQVLKMQKSDRIICTNDKQQQAECQLEFPYKKDKANYLKILSWKKQNDKKNNHHLLRLSIDVFLSVPKPQVLSSLLPKLSELNVMSLTPVFTQRSFLKNQQQINYSRLNKICEESLKQCTRKIPLKIYQAIKLRDLKNLDRIKNSHLIFPFEGEKTKWIHHYPLSNLSEFQSINFSSTDSPNLYHQSICLLMGPEGGFELNEADFIKKTGFKAVGLGPHVMKVETACIYSVACINALFFRDVPYQHF